MYVKRKEIFKNVRRTVPCNQDIVRRINVFGRPYYYVKEIVIEVSLYHNAISQHMVKNKAHILELLMQSV